MPAICDPKNSFALLKFSKSAIAIVLIITLFLVATAIPLAQAKGVQTPGISGGDQHEKERWAKVKEKLHDIAREIRENLHKASKAIRVYQEPGGVSRFEEYIPLSPELGAPPGSFYTVNVYAFHTRGGVVLVDCGVEGLYPQLRNAIRERFHREPIVAVLLTHGHADHAGAGHYFVDAGVPVYASIADSYLIQLGMHFPGSQVTFHTPVICPRHYFTAAKTCSV